MRYTIRSKNQPKLWGAKTTAQLTGNAFRVLDENGNEIAVEKSVEIIKNGCANSPFFNGQYWEMDVWA